MRNLTSSELSRVVGGSRPPGLLGYEGQPGNQGGNPPNGNPSNSATPEVPAGNRPQPNP